MPEKYAQAYWVLKEHNEWRRGGDGPMTDPKTLWLAVEAALEVLQPYAAQPTPDTLNQSTCLGNTINKSDNLKVSNYINVTEYCDRNNINLDRISAFKRIERVRPFINTHSCVATSGRGGRTLFNEDLFDLFLRWLKREPLALINRQESDIYTILSALVPDIERQYNVGQYVYDFYLPRLNLLIEYDDEHHFHSSGALSKIEDKREFAFKRGYKFFTIRQREVSIGLAALIKIVLISTPHDH